MLSFQQHSLSLLESEARIPVLKQWFLDKVDAHFSKSNHDHLAKLIGPIKPNSRWTPHILDNYVLTMFDDALFADRTPKKIYLQWILNNIIKSLPINAGTTWKEDKWKVKADLDFFEEHKRQFEQVHRDINLFNFETLAKFIEEQRNEDLRSQRQVKKEEIARLKKDIDIVYDGPEGTVYVPKTEETSRYLGRGTKWCTAYTDHQSYFDQYNRRGPLFDLVHKDGPKWQFHFQDEQFMNESDHQIPIDTIHASSLFKAARSNILRYLIVKSVLKLSKIGSKTFEVLYPTYFSVPDADKKLILSKGELIPAFVEWADRAFPESDTFFARNGTLSEIINYATSIKQKRFKEAEKRMLDLADNEYYPIDSIFEDYMKPLGIHDWPEYEQNLYHLRYAGANSSYLWFLNEYLQWQKYKPKELLDYLYSLIRLHWKGKGTMTGLDGILWAVGSNLQERLPKDLEDRFDRNQRTWMFYAQMHGISI